MDAVKNFKIAMTNWMCKHDFSNVELDFEYDFGYAIDEENDIHCINIGVANCEDACNYFEQFLYENGCEYTGIPYPVLCFLHELGHVRTIDNFTQDELRICRFIKAYGEEEEDYEYFTHYWMTPDEFAANMWAVSFINENIEAVEDLCMTFCAAWNTLINSINVFDLVSEE